MDWELTGIETEDLLDEIRGPLRDIIYEFHENYDKENSLNKITRFSNELYKSYFMDHDWIEIDKMLADRKTKIELRKT